MLLRLKRVVEDDSRARHADRYGEKQTNFLASKEIIFHKNKNRPPSIPFFTLAIACMAIILVVVFTDKVLDRRNPSCVHFLDKTYLNSLGGETNTETQTDT